MVLTLRPATHDDSAAIAELYQMAAGGVADYIWRDIAEGDETILDAGARRFSREGEEFSFENCTIAEDASGIAGMCLAYSMTARTAMDDDFDPVLRPYCELELVPSYYIGGIAAYPNRRGQGVGARLLADAHGKAAAMGMPHVSLIAFEQNDGAVRLYRRQAYDVVDRHPVVPHDLIQYSGDALLMARPV